MDQQQPTQSATVNSLSKPFVNPYKRSRSSYTSSNNTNSTASAASNNTTNAIATNDINHLDESTLIASTGASLMRLPLAYAVNLRQNPDTLSLSLKNDTSEHSHETTTIESNKNQINDNNDSDHQLKQSSTDHKKNHKQTISQNFSLAERLPTNNVSFSFATILTVPETRKAIGTHTNHLCSKCNNSPIEQDSTNEHHNLESNLIHHVRVSGTVVYMDPKGQFLIMGDALFQPRPNAKMRSLIKPTTSSIISDTVPKVAPSPAVNASNKTMISTSLSGKKQRLITVKKNTSSSLMKSTNKFGIKSLGSSITTAATTTATTTAAATTTTTAAATVAATTTAAAATISSLIQSNHNNRHRSNTTTMSPVEQIVQKKGDMDMIMIDISKMETVIGKEGDNIMVIGDIHSNSSFDVLNDISNEWILALQCLRRKWCTDNNYTINDSITDKSNTTSVLKSSCHCMGWIEAKIVKDITGTDMPLYQEALEMRRAYFNDQKTIT